MRTSAIPATLKTLVSTKLPVMMHGAPGVGKSDIVRAVADDLGIDLIDVRLSQLDPVDLRGVPSVTGGETKWNVPSFLPKSGRGILFLDEINSAPQAVQAAAYQLVLDRKLGDYTLPEGWAIVAAGNRTGDRAIVNKMATPLKNRFAHIDVEIHIDDWTQWAFGAGIDPLIIGFLRYKPECLHEFLPRGGKSENEKKRMDNLIAANAFSTPRTWSYADKLIKAGLAKDAEHAMLVGTIGEESTIQFNGYRKYWSKMPALETILMSPEKAALPDDPIVRYAVATALVPKASDLTLDNIMIYLDRMAEKELSVVFFKDALARDQTLATLPAFQKWASANAHLLY